MATADIIIVDMGAVAANSDQLKKEERYLQDTFVPIQARHKVWDKVWVINTDKIKLLSKKVGSTIILKVNNNNTT
ncbi:hypothetical protein DSO57_1014949 [Entomophthora muscae]|uniref:Uncharacterized protein n=1 Tax=Entomophthora muscae TaxID=34485 RepID=A0ACC2TG53_9FUNG|nr:hypothetical protein DSO57_1014949 [Entomophthora muscae]